MKSKPLPQPWGNSVLFINLKHWVCAYCGLLIKDHTPFSIVILKMNPTPYILCSANCLKIQIIKLDAALKD
jgi:hypothetical protein